MPWNDNANPGPWGSPPPEDNGRDKPERRQGGGPRGPRRPEGPGGGPEFDAALDRLRRRLSGLFGGPGQGIRPGVVAAIAGAAFGLWALSGLYVVQPNEEAVVITFGAYSRSEGPGLRYHLPSPIEHVEKVPVTSLNRIDIGGAPDAEAPQESLMLTADENIVNLTFSTTWRVNDAARYVFSTRNPEEAVKAVAESAMREVIGTTPLDQIMTTGRGEVETHTVTLMQRTLDSWGAGVSVVGVQIRSASPPPEVVAAFRDVSNAEQDADSARNEANTYRNRVVNEAKGDGARIVQSAQAYREQSVRDALGDAARFNQILGEYKRAPGVTRERLYLETMERVLAHSNKVVVSGKATTAPIILPPDVFRPRTLAPPAAPPQQQSAEPASDAQQAQPPAAKAPQ
ncbi:FtsH protease activity modulator HflK [Phenylobacterium sp.]|uniref:FtsH protease activity modulator HflK n=1 Tax=Phenylobacterium sp. TaxID=1871053 RepID=UPI002DEBECFD|nr:FtsH protease activity modulator HflK [Phenylobacterium sp.]